MITILIVDDSPTARTCLRRVFERDPELLVVGEAEDGRAAMKLIGRFDPDVVTMDVFLGKENGLKLTSEIMAESPRPILVITGVNTPSPEVIYEAMARGAVDVAAKPQNLSGDEYEAAAKQLRRLVRALSGVPRVHLRRARAKLHGTIAEISSFQAKSTYAHEARPRVVLIGASTGGPPLVADLLHAIPRPVSIPVLIAQHMSAGFGDGFASWLTDCTKHPASVVKGNTKLIASVYLAPDSQSLRLLSPATLAPSSVTNAAGTSIDELFASAAEVFGPAVLAFLLTGMGKDGAAGLKKIRDAGGKTVAQEPKTCAVDSMPRSAIELEAVSAIMTPAEMGELLRQTMAARLPAS